MKQDPLTREAITAALKVSLDKSIGHVAPEYVSFTIDAAQLSHSGFLWRDDTVDLLASALSPAHLRVGGTQADYNVEVEDFRPAYQFGSCA